MGTVTLIAHGYLIFDGTVTTFHRVSSAIDATKPFSIMFGIVGIMSSIKSTGEYQNRIASSVGPPI